MSEPGGRPSGEPLADGSPSRQDSLTLRQNRPAEPRLSQKLRENERLSLQVTKFWGVLLHSKR